MILRALAKSLVLPPALQLLGLLLAWWCWRRRPRLAKGLLLASVGSLWLLSLAPVSQQLLLLLDRTLQPVSFQLLAQQQVIVVLGGGRRREALEYQQRDTVNHLTLLRLRYAAQLQRQSGLPLLVSGGSVFKPEATAEAELMAGVLESEFGVQVNWRESGSRTTAENARRSYQLLQAEGINRVALVTHSWHMPRARAVFERAGFEVLPAPMGFTRRDTEFGPRHWIPSAGALQASRYALHEILGGWVYRFTERDWRAP